MEQTTGIRFLWVPGGSFTMGADDIDEDSKPPHTVKVSSFWLGETPVTNAQFRPYVEATGREPVYWNDRKYNQDLQPVVGVTWEAAVAYCAWLTERLEGQAVARLPSEAWWERAARGDDGRRYPWGDDAPSAERAWYDQGFEAGPKAVGSYPLGVGPYGHLDLAGNVWEWCQDVWDAQAYRKKPHKSKAPDPEVTKGNEKLHSRRGGSYWNRPGGLQAAVRLGLGSDHGYRVLGFRVAVSPPSTGGSGGGAP